MAVSLAGQAPLGVAAEQQHGALAHAAALPQLLRQVALPAGLLCSEGAPPWRTVQASRLSGSWDTAAGTARTAGRHADLSAVPKACCARSAAGKSLCAVHQPAPTRVCCQHLKASTTARSAGSAGSPPTFFILHSTPLMCQGSQDQGHCCWEQLALQCASPAGPLSAKLSLLSSALKPYDVALLAACAHGSSSNQTGGPR